MEERYIQPIRSAHPKSAGGLNKPANIGTAMAPPIGTTIAGMANPMSNIPNMMNAPMTGAMPYMDFKPNMGPMPEMAPAKPNMGAMPEMTAKPNTGAMPYMDFKPNMGVMPEMPPTKPNMGATPNIETKPNMGPMPEMMPAKPNMGTMPEMMPAKPNMGMMPEMTPAKPNMGMMPEMTPAKPNMGMMPEMTPAKPNMGMMPEMMPAKPNMGVMPEMMPAKPNMGMMPEMMPAKPNMGMMPEKMPPKPNMGAMPNMEAKSNVGMMPEKINMPNAFLGAENDMSGCGYKNGELPPCAPLAAGFIPWQQKNPPKYGNMEALTRGTLFPGLDLPFMNNVNKTNPYAGTPLGEYMALGFVIKELNLYLDTHPKDKDALDMLKNLNKLMQEATEKIVKMYGPQTIMDVMSGDEFTWIDNPWPWEYNEKGASENHV